LTDFQFRPEYVMGVPALDRPLEVKHTNFSQKYF